MLLAVAGVVEGEDAFDYWLPHERTVLQAGKEVQGDYFAFGPHVEISGTVNGDVYAAGGEVLVDGTVNGDLIAAGGTVIVSGRVSQDARLAGGQVTVSGTIGRNATVAGADVQAIESSHVQGNWLAAGGKVRLSGPVDGHARIAGGNVMVSDTIGGDLFVAAPTIRLTSNASIGRHFRYWSGADPSIDEGAKIRGTVSSRPFPETLKAKRFYEGLTALRFAGTAISFVSTLILGLILVRAYPVFSLAMDWTIRERPGASIGIGAAALIGIPFLILFCFATVLGIPLGLVLGALYVVTLYIGRIFVMLWAGQLLLLLVSESPSPSWAFVTGLVVYSLFTLVPFIGSLVTLVTVILGLGALLVTKRALIEQLREKHLV